MNMGRAFVYMIQQPGGLGKILIGGLLLFVPIIGWALVAGYFIRTLREVSLGGEKLPEWTDFGDLLVKGLLVWAGSLLYQLPGFLLSGGNDFNALGSLWSLVVFVVLPAALIRFAVTDNFGAFFDFSDIFSFIQRNLNNYVMVLVLSLVAWFLSLFGFILLVLGVVFTFFWASLVVAHLYGSVYATREVEQANA